MEATKNETARQRRETARIEEGRHKKFDRNLRIIAGVVTVLGAAATTLMKVMEAEQAYRKSKTKRVKGRGARPKQLKAPPKAKARRIPRHFRLLSNTAALHNLQIQANKALRMAKSLRGGGNG